MTLSVDKRRGICLPVLVVALVVMAGGCGGGGSQRLSHNEFIKQANASCDDFGRRIVALRPNMIHVALDPKMMAVALRSPSTLTNLVAWSEKRLSITKQQLGKIKQLKPPTADEANWRAYTASGGRAIGWLDKLHYEAVRHDGTALVKLAAYGQKEAARETRIAQKLRLAECG